MQKYIKNTKFDIFEMAFYVFFKTTLFLFHSVGIIICFCFPQPKPDDEEGWKKFCLGEKLYLDTSVQVTSDEDQGIDYIQVSVTSEQS